MRAKETQDKSSQRKLGSRKFINSLDSGFRRNDQSVLFESLPKAARGFTLIEVLIALAVLAIALAAIMRALAQTIDTTTALRDRMLAQWVAQDRLVTHRITRNWPSIDTTEGEAEMGGLKFKYREKVMGTPVSEMRRVEIEVLAFDKPDVLTSIAGYLRQPAAPAFRP